MMKYIFVFMLFGCISSYAQSPAIVKAVNGTTAEPFTKDQEGWKNNEWNGLFFYQGTGSPTKLCVTDGTNAGTVSIADIGTGNISSTIPAQGFMYVITVRATFVLVGGSFVLTTINEIWKSNGTAGGTSLVFTMPGVTGVGNSNLFSSDIDSKRNFSVIGNTMFFSGYNNTNGSELWVTDGTTAGTHIVKDINPGTGNSSPAAFCKIGSTVFFTAIESSGRKLWKTDGTALGTVQIPVAEPFFILDNAVGIVNNKMIFYAHNTIDGYEPYVSDGTAAGTFMLKNINPTGNSWITQSQNAHLRFNTKNCFFIANNGTANALWRTDGTTNGTIQLTDNALGVFSGVSGGSYTDVDSTGFWMLQYNAAGSGNSEKLYRSNGTVNGTYLAAENLSYAQNVKIYKSALWMASRNVGSAANVEPWRCGGNAATTNKAFEIEPGNSGSPTFTPLSANPYGFFVKNNKLYFFASTSIPSAHNLYQYNGDFTFNGGLPGNKWSDSANWSGMMPPGITDSVYFPLSKIANTNGKNAYAGTLTMEVNSAVSLTNATDSLYINTKLNAVANPTIGGAGVAAFKNIQKDTVQIYQKFVSGNVAIMSNTNATDATGGFGNAIEVPGNLNLVNDAKFKINDLNILIPFTSSTLTQTGNSYINTNGAGVLRINNIGPTGKSGNVLFPVGTDSFYNPVIIKNTGTTTLVELNVHPGLFGTYFGSTGFGTPYNNYAVNNTWNIYAGGTPNIEMTLQWDATQELPGFDRSLAYLGHYAGGSWDLGLVGNASGTNPYTLTRTGITSFSPFGVLNNNLILPLQFLSFTALICSNDQACLQWKTANEYQVNNFEVERSVDGVHFITIGSVAAANQTVNNYSFSDQAVPGAKIYYRIKQTDRDGKIKYSKIISLKMRDKGFTLYPTIFHSSFTVQNNAATNAILQLVNSKGQLILLQQLHPGTNQVTVSSQEDGILLFTIIRNDKKIQSGKLFKSK